MRLYITTQCIIIYLLSSTYYVNSQNLFDMFNDIKDQVVDKVDYASTKVKEKVEKHVRNLVCYNYEKLSSVYILK